MLVLSYVVVVVDVVVDIVLTLAHQVRMRTTLVFFFSFFSYFMPETLSTDNSTTTM